MHDFQPPFDQASGIPFRTIGCRTELCLITSARKRRWGFPKGYIENGDNFTLTALREAYEEAGVAGRVLGDLLGSYYYRKRGKRLHVAVTLLHVTRCEQVWPEMHRRDRVWVEAEEAQRMISRRDFREVLGVAIQRIHLFGDFNTAAAS